MDIIKSVVWNILSAYVKVYEYGDAAKCWYYIGTQGVGIQTKGSHVQN